MGTHRGLAGRFAPFLTAAAVVSLPLASIGAAPAASASAADHPSRYASRVIPAVGNPVSYVREGKAQSGAPVFSCQAPTATIPCYGPAQIRAAYDVPSSLTGAGRTIVIVDAFQSPTIAHDLHVFDSAFGLPDPTLNIIAPDGLTAFDPTNADEVNWSAEISLDVEWSHAIAPGATIDLVLAKSDQDADIYSAQHYVVGHNLGDALSQSFGEGETCMDLTLMANTHSLFALAALKRMSVFASSGDSGAAQPDCNGDGNYFLSASTPASDPLVTGVGGTHLNANFTTGAYQSETAWNNSGESADLDFGASGGGFSTVYSRPLYQFGQRTSGRRGLPDVAYNGDVLGGVLVAWSSSGQGANLVFIFGGTSAGSPQWSGLAALADQAAGHRLGFLNPALYAISHGLRYRYAFHDITTGNNSWDVSGVTGYPAGRGWDPVTGVGSPDFAHLIGLLAR